MISASEKVVLRRLEVTEPLDERGEGTLDRYVDNDLATDDGIIGHVHDFSSGGLFDEVLVADSAPDSRRCRAGRAGRRHRPH